MTAHRLAALIVLGAMAGGRTLPAQVSAADPLIGPVDRDSVRFALAGGLGEFRGVRSRDGSEIAGFWVQPAGVVLSQPYASPVGCAGSARTCGAAPSCRSTIASRST